MGDNLEVVWAEFSTLSYTFLLSCKKVHSTHTTTSRVENSANFLSCQLMFVHVLVEAVSQYGMETS
jgi:hypothetical protein